MQEKINKINSLDKEVGNIRDVLSAYEAHGKLYDGKEEKKNKIGSITVDTYIWTGSQNPKYTKVLTSEDAINEIKEATVKILSRLLKEKGEELEKLVI